MKSDLFYIGNPCKRGHSGIRYKSTKACRECCAITDKQLKARRRAGKPGRNYYNAELEQEAIDNHNPVLSNFLKMRLQA